MSNLRTFPGSRWWKFDFHSHTPASADYGKGINQTQLQQTSCKEWLLNYMRQEIDCVAITDHNSGAWIDPLKQALNELESRRHPEYRPIYIFPGVEITASGNLHILAIFDLEKTTSHIDSLLGAVKYRGTKGESNACSECSAVEVISEIKALGGIAIPAHVDMANGLFEIYNGNALEQLLDSKDIFAIELRDKAYTKPQLYHDKKLNWAEVIGTDSHHPLGQNGQRYPGSHFTWVKMSTPCYDGLRLALLDGESSLKHSDIFSGNPNSHGQNIIKSISIDNAKYLGRGEPLLCELNPWLNTIIGGRGTGKSSSLEFIRLALKRKEELPEGIKSDFTKYALISCGNDEGLLTENTKITILFQKDDNIFRILWSKNEHIIEEQTSEGIWTLSGGDIAQRFPIRIYSQKQIFELAKHPQALLKVIDDAPAVDYYTWYTEWKELIAKYLSVCAQKREIEAGLLEESTVKGQLEDVVRKLEVFEKAGHADVLKNYQLRCNQNNSIDSWERGIDNYIEKIKGVSNNSLPLEVDSQYFDLTNAEDNELIATTTDIISQLKQIQNEINVHVQRIEDVKSAWHQKRQGLTISESIVKSNTDYISLCNQLRDVDAGDPSTYALFVQQKQSLENTLKGFDEKRKNCNTLQEKAKECLQEIYRHRAKLTQLRKDFLNATLQNNEHVKITVIPFGDVAKIEREIRNLIERDSGGFERDLGSIYGDEGLLPKVYQNASKSFAEKSEELKRFFLDVYSNGESSINETKDRRFVSHIQTLTPEHFNRIECWFPEDSLEVEYYDDRRGEFKSLLQGSPGQKTATLLAFILSYGDEPLIFDQPEDDLDNSLIYDLIVTGLRKIKQKRQILVVTHNANIVVNGDAENIIVLGIKRGQTRIETQGGLQELEIRDKVCQIMEGGKQAFEQRYKRINANS